LQVEANPTVEVSIPFEIVRPWRAKPRAQRSEAPDLARHPGDPRLRE
jgi:hypothetical protein